MLSIAAFGFSGSDLINKFNSWKKTHGKAYETADHEAAALAGFSANEAFINEHNAAGHSYQVGHNEFSDMTFDEFQAKYLASGMGLHQNRAPKNMDRKHITGYGPKSADSVDWTTKGAVTPVKNQGQCGSCWSFSTTGSLEGSYAISQGSLTSFSEENLVQCDNSAHGGSDQGCQGGLMDNAFEWIETNGLCTEAAYPYTSGTGTTGTCKKTCTPVVTVTKYTDVPQGDETALQTAIAKQPVSIAVDAEGSGWQLYKSGTYSSPTCGTQLDHGVLLVGYDSGAGYYKLKNSWGTTWGLEGYMHIKMGSNECGLANSASYPTAKPMGPAPPPGPAPGPSPTPPSPPSSSHYEDPKDGCQTDETQVSIQGVTGDFCAPKCSLFKACPTDLPTGVTAAPQCAISDASTKQKYCALICSPTSFIADQKAADAQCGENASCKSIQTVGICTYDD
tara:strand:+ start:53 stop:1399 length:1347 start_codon:yes stop_codon:yes gene_type:complete